MLCNATLNSCFHFLHRTFFNTKLYEIEANQLSQTLKANRTPRDVISRIETKQNHFFLRKNKQTRYFVTDER